MKPAFRGVVDLDIRNSVPDWAPFEQPRAAAGTPNVVYIVLDDVGFSAMSCYGGPIDTPNIDRIAAQGLRYAQWHTTALCSPTRSCLLTGRNHTTNGMACITEAATGFPNGNGHVPAECATLPEVLVERGVSTAMVGKWHLCAQDEMNLAASKRNWPLGRGFERFYEFIDDVKTIAPDRPVFLYYALGAAHAPHHVPQEWADRYRGRFDMGYEAAREQILARQKQLGIVPENTELPPINPIGTPGDRTGPEDKAFPALDYTKPWDSLSADERPL